MIIRAVVTRLALYSNLKIPTIYAYTLVGIFMKYDLSSLMVQITQVRRPVGLFLVRLCGIVGGVFATSGNRHNIVYGLFIFFTGMLHSIIGLIFDIIFCRRTTSNSSQDPASVSNTSSSNPTTPSTPTADHMSSEKTSLT